MRSIYTYDEFICASSWDVKSKLDAQIEEAEWEVEDSQFLDSIDPEWPKDETPRRERRLEELLKQRTLHLN